MKNDSIDIGKVIFQILKEKKRSIAWLAREIDLDKSNLNKILKNSRYIYVGLVYKISRALEYDFFAYGSQKLNENNNTW
jgi:predicted transcriptional regulator